MTSDPLNILSPAERQELEQIQAHLKRHAKTDFQHLPERTVNAVFNNASPTVRQFLKNNRDFIQDLDAGGGRYRPFQDRLDVNALVPNDSKPILDRAMAEELSHGLTQRMTETFASTPAPSSESDSPPTAREILSAAFDHHEGSTND